MGGCAVPGCSSRSEIHYQDGIKFSSIPALRKNVPLHAQSRYERRRALWLSKIGRMDLMYEGTNIRICSRHFISGKPSAPSAETCPDWAPSLYLKDANQVGNVITTVKPERDHPVATQPEGDHHEDSKLSVQSQDCLAAPVQTGQQMFDECENSIILNSTSILDTEQNGSESKHALRNDGDMLQNMVCGGAVSPEDYINVALEEKFSVDKDDVNSAFQCDNIKRKFQDLQAEYNDLVKSRVKLRNDLTEAEVDKLELSQALTSSEEKCEYYAKKCAALEIECEYIKLKEQKYEARIKDLEEQAKISNDKICVLEAKLEKATKCTLTLEQLQNDDKLVTYYTGLPSYDIFNTVLTLINTHITDKTRSLQPWQCLLLTLMRLRLRLQLEDLAYRFGVCHTTVSNVFEKWRHYLYVYLEPSITLQDKDTA